VPSSELLICKECGQSFDTVESLGEQKPRQGILGRLEHYSGGLLYNNNNNNNTCHLSTFVILLLASFPLMLEGYNEIFL
jgi:hypothetical protein